MHPIIFSHREENDEKIYFHHSTLHSNHMDECLCFRKKDIWVREDECLWKDGMFSDNGICGYLYWCIGKYGRKSTVLRVEIWRYRRNYYLCGQKHLWIWLRNRKSRKNRVFYSRKLFPFLCTGRENSGTGYRQKSVCPGWTAAAHNKG